MQRELVEELKKIKIEIDNKPWRPHVTIGRNKFGEQIRELDKIDLRPIKWIANEVILFESELLPSGPRYTRLSYANFRS